jgi:hypothetical protein
MSNHLRTATTMTLGEGESSASFEAAPPQQLSLFMSMLTTSEPFEACEVTGPGKSGKGTGNYLQSRSPAG